MSRWPAWCVLDRWAWDLHERLGFTSGGGTLRLMSGIHGDGHGAVLSCDMTALGAFHGSAQVVLP